MKPYASQFHLFQELSTLGQQLAHTLSLRQGLSRVESMFPSGSPRTRQSLIEVANAFSLPLTSSQTIYE